MMPDSLYRARLLSESDTDGDTGTDDAKKPVVLPWLGWDAKTMLLTDVRNIVEAWSLAQAGDGKTDPAPVHYPSYKEPSELPHGEVGLDDFMMTAQLFGIG